MAGADETLDALLRTDPAKFLEDLRRRWPGRNGKGSSWP